MVKSVVWGCLLAVTLPVWAQTAPSTAKRAVKLTAAKPAAEVPVERVLAPLSVELLAVADKVSVGAIPCELSATVTITRDPQAPGRFILRTGREKHWLEPVTTSTGAVRLEDAQSGAVWLQLSNKSMLINQKLGKRIADACMDAEQLRVAQAMELSPPVSLLEPLPTETAPPAVRPAGAGRALASATD